ncbi:unnamed protein product [Trichobilharzia regenti]|nr:unnamed protein product [Trichobilharzia regenti]
MNIYLRIKRSNSDFPSSICETENLIKRPKNDVQSVKFRYIGSQKTSKCPHTDKIDEVCESSDKLCKIVCNKSDATVVDEERSVKCQVKVNSLKRPASNNIFDQFNNLNVDSSDKSTGPRPPKILKIIELIPESTLSTSLKCNNKTDGDENDGNTNENDKKSSESNFVYDIYKMMPDSNYSAESIIWCPDDDISSNDNPLIKNMHNYICDDDDQAYDDGDVRNHDDEDDSNSESNWRNDYPDEMSSSSDSDRSKSNTESDCDYYY